MCALGVRSLAPCCTHDTKFPVYYIQFNAFLSWTSSRQFNCNKHAQCTRLRERNSDKAPHAFNCAQNAQIHSHINLSWCTPCAWTRNISYMIEELGNALVTTSPYRSGISHLANTAAERKREEERWFCRLHWICICTSSLSILHQTNVMSHFESTDDFVLWFVLNCFHTLESDFMVIFRVETASNNFQLAKYGFYFHE